MKKIVYFPTRDFFSCCDFPCAFVVGEIFHVWQRRCFFFVNIGIGEKHGGGNGDFSFRLYSHIILWHPHHTHTSISSLNFHPHGFFFCRHSPSIFTLDLKAHANEFFMFL